MSFIKNDTSATVYAPGYFLAHEECVRETRQVAANDSRAITTDDGGKYVPMGAPYPEAGANAEGLLYEPIDISVGAAAGSVVTQGIVIKDRIDSDLLTASTITALEGKGFIFKSSSAVTRPY
jgi:hypothetical protein